MVRTALVLAGGRGTRLAGILPGRQKVVALVRGRPFLAYVLDQLADAGVERAVLCTGHLSAQVRMTFGDRYGRLALAYARETTPLGTAGALRHALPLCDDDPILALNGDSRCPVDLRAFVDWATAQPAAGALVVTRVDDVARYGAVAVGSDCRVTSFVEKGGEHGPGLVNAGIYCLARRLVDEIPIGRAVSLETEMLPAWLADGLVAYQAEASLLDIGTPDALRAAEHRL